MDWTWLPCPDNYGEISTTIGRWKEFLASLTGTRSMSGAIETALSTGYFERIDVNADMANYTVDLTLTSKGIREASEAHQNKERVSIHTYLPESLQGLSVEELSERVLESPKDYEDFHSAITTASMRDKVRKMPHYDARNNPYLSYGTRDSYYGDHIHLNF